MTESWVTRPVREMGATRTWWQIHHTKYCCCAFESEVARELPVEQPSRFMRILNLKTAETLGLTFHSTLLLQAEEAIR